MELVNKHHITVILPYQITLAPKSPLLGQKPLVNLKAMPFLLARSKVNLRHLASLLAKVVLLLVYVSEGNPKEFSK